VSTHAAAYLREVGQIAASLSPEALGRLASEIRTVRDSGGRLFIAGLGGGAANASHAAADLRKLAGLEAYALGDNVAELTARANDEGWRSIYTGALVASRATARDALLVLSVGGGTGGVSLPLIKAINLAKSIGMRVLGIVGRDGGHAKLRGDCVVVVPTVQPARITPHTEAFQIVILHYLVSHPELQSRPTKW